ncbi:NAD(P)-binding protein [Mycena polygramma]|nr:NAD(P)-binding protein [Mycena polygramma]
MTITQDPSAPLVAVVGAIGVQGGSVVKALAESDKQYRVRGFTRDGAKPAAQNLSKLGVEIFVVSFVVENKAEVYKAFVGANFAFLMTNFWEHLDKDREINEGKLLVDAAKAGGVSRIVWSGLPSITKLTGGKFVNVYHWDSKAAVTEYGRQSGVPFVDVQAGFYGTNLLTSPVFLAKQDDGSFAMPLPMKPTATVPFIDTEEDYGLFVREVLERPVFPDGAEILAYSETLAAQDLAKQVGKATGKTVVYREIPIEQFTKGVQALGLPPHIVLDMTESFQSWAEFGWGEDVPPHNGLARSTRTWAEFVQAKDWSNVLA